jgi:hypothetical protein
MPFNVSEFASAGLPFGGARPSLFSVIIDTPSGVPNVGARTSFTCRAAQIPQSSVGVIEQAYYGRRIKIAGTRTFANWRVDILNDEDFQVRAAMEIWSNAINTHQSNLRAPNLATTASYRTTATVTQYAKTGEALRTYRFVNIFPTEVGAIDLAWENGEQVETFPVEFAYDYWDLTTPGNTGTLAV